MFWEAQNAGFLHPAKGGIQEGLIRRWADLVKTSRRKRNGTGKEKRQE
jgi:hypothetical protein